MKENETKKIKEKKLSILLLQSAIVIGCIIIFCVVMTPKDRVKDTTYSYSKLEEVKEYEIEGNYITRVRPLTEYTTFKETAEYTLNNNEEGITYTIKVYPDSNKTQEITEGYIKSGMVIEGTGTGEIEKDEEESELISKTVTYTISVIGDFTKDGDISIAELTKIIKGVVGLNAWRFTEEEKLIADFNGDKKINVVDIEECINYIVYGKLTLENGMKLKATDENGITWNYTYQNGEATDVYYESGILSSTVNIPASLEGYPVVSLVNSENLGNIFIKGDEARAIGKDYSSLPIKNVVIPNSVIYIGENAFERCSNIISITISNNVTEIGDSAFLGCSSLNSIEIPKGVTTIVENTFSGCSSLANITIPEGVTSIGSSAFYGCTSLISIEIPNTVISIGNIAFSYCTELANIKIPNSVTSIGSDAFSDTAWYNSQPDGVVYSGRVAYKYKGEMLADTKVELIKGTKGIASDAFSGRTSLISIEIPNTVISIGEYAFYGCTGLIEVNIPESVTSIEDRAFEFCTGLTEITIPGSVESIQQGIFSNCENLIRVDLLEGVTSIEWYAFSGCTSLISIEIPDSVISIDRYAFEDTGWYREQPEGVVYAGKVVYTYKGTMPSSGTIEIKEGTKGIGNGAFFNYKSLTNVTIPDSVIIIEQDAFLWCENLKTVTMSKNLEYIGEGAFAGCTSLENIVIWKNVDEVGNRTFGDWNEEQTVNIEVNEVPEGWHEEWNKECNAKIVYGYTGD